MHKLFLTTSLAALLAACSPPAEEAATPETETEAPTEAEAPETDAANEDEEEEAAGLPGNDIWLFQMVVDGENRPVLADSPRNLTDRPGYDNQPWFAGGEILYTRGDDATGETDIWAVDLESGAQRQVTDTPDESEYSPRIAPNGQLSYIYQPPGGYGGFVYLAVPDNSDRAPAFDANPFGYYLFNAQMDRVVTFALTDPLTLTINDLRADPPESGLLSEGPGRALSRSPSGRVDAYLTLQAEGDLGVALHDFNFEDLELRLLGLLPGGAQDFAVTASPIPDADLIPVDRLFAIDNGHLMYADLVGRPGEARLDWTPVAGGDLARHRLAGVTRLAASPDGSLLAVVAVVAEDMAE